MERLTERFNIEGGTFYKIKSPRFVKEYISVDDKLGQLEDIEEKHNMSIDEMDAYITEHKKIEQELGIKLSVLFKAQTSLELFFIDLEKTNYGYIFSMPTSDCSFNLSNKTLHICGDAEDYELKDYGTTWALTKEELEE